MSLRRIGRHALTPALCVLAIASLGCSSPSAQAKPNAEGEGGKGPNMKLESTSFQRDG